MKNFRTRIKKVRLVWNFLVIELFIVLCALMKYAHDLETKRQEQMRANLKMRVVHVCG